MCQRLKLNREIVAPVGEVELSTSPFQEVSLDITGSYVATTKRNMYLLTFSDHFTMYVDAFLIPDQTADICARINATQIVSRHGTVSQLISENVRSLLSSFFPETFKVLGKQTTSSTCYHPQSNGSIEMWHRLLHCGWSHYINSSNNNLDTLVAFYLMSYRATPNSVTAYSPFFVLHGREMEIPNNDKLEARICRKNQNQ